MLASIALLVTSAAAHGLGDDPPLAPDGRPGLGTALDARGYGELLRDPPPDRAEDIAAWRGLEGEIRVLRELAERAARERGDFALLGGDADRRPSLDALHARFHELEDDPPAAVRAPKPAGEVFARLFVDARFRLRMEAFEAAADEARDLRGGLALLLATQDGYVLLGEEEARAIARRVDLSAALLRAIRLDLEALRPTREANAIGAPDPEEVGELRALASAADPAERRARLADLRARVERVERRMESTLFAPALRTRLSHELARREVGRERARERLRELRPFLPETEEGRDPPPSIAALKKHERHGAALRIAIDGLALDPLDEDLAYCAGLGSDFLYDRRQSRTWFDRYLALRGIRAHDHRTYDRELSDEERHALQMVQFLPPLGR